MSFHRIADVARGQHGLITIDQIVSAGLAASTATKWVEQGRLDRIEPGLYRIGGSAVSDLQEIMAAVLGVGGLVAASHLTAAYLWGLISFPPPLPHVVTTALRWRARPTEVHRSVDLTAGQITSVKGVPVTSPARTIVDSCAVAGPSLCERMLDEGIRLELTSVSEVGAFVKSVAKRGRTGVVMARAMVEDRSRWSSQTESVLEDRFLRIVLAAGLPEPVAQFEVRSRYGTWLARVDFAYPALGLLIEIDGFRYHSDASTFHHDRARQNRLVGAGFTILRFTARDLESGASVIEALDRVIAQRQQHPPFSAS